MMRRESSWSLMSIVMGLAALLAMVAPATLAAQASDDQTATEVVLDSIAGTAGRSATYVRTATPAGDLLTLHDLDMGTRVLLGVRPVDGASPIEVALYKNGIPEPVRRATASDGSYLFEFRTYAEVGIEVKARQNSDYVLAVLTAPLPASPIPNPFSSVAAPVARAGEANPDARGVAAATSPTMFAVGFVLLLAAGAIGFRLARGKRAKVALLLVLAVPFAQGLDAQGSAPPPPQSPGDWRNLASSAWQYSPTLVVGTGGRITTGTGGTGGGLGQVGDAGRLKEIEALWQSLMLLAGKLGEVSRLGPYDRDYEPQLAPPGMPRVSLRCANDPACQACFAPSYAELNGVRSKLENNRIVLAHYTRRMQVIEDAGRAMGGMHGATGILFLKNKQEWDAQRASIGGKYDERYTVLMTALQTALRQMEGCEARVYGTRDWYDNYGFMYYEFMAARYRRTGGAF